MLIEYEGDHPETVRELIDAALGIPPADDAARVEHRSQTEE